MKDRDPLQSAGDIAFGISQLTEGLAHLCLALSLAPFRTGRPNSQRTELLFTLHELRRLFREALGDGNEAELVAILNSINEHRDRLERAVVVWVDLIEVLVQNTERRYGSKPGRGVIKAAEVKAVVRYLLRTDRLDLDIPYGPRYVTPVIIDALVSFTLDALVSMANRYGLWIEVEPSPQSLAARIIILLRSLFAYLRPIVAPVARLINRIWFASRARFPLSPALRSALKAVEREGLVGDEKSIVTGALGLVVWIGTHRDQVIAFFDLVFSAVQEAESYLALSGREKKAYARNLVLAVLDDLGFEERAGLLFSLIDASISGAIEAAVHLFNKRGIFVP